MEQNPQIKRCVVTNCTHHLVQGPYGSSFPGTVVVDGGLHDSNHYKLDPTSSGTISRNIRPDDSIRPKLYLDHQLADRIDIYAENVRPMTKDELKEHGPGPVLDFPRPVSYLAYYIGDIVKVYDERVNDEIGFNNERIRKEDKLKEKPKDVGIILDNGKGNKYWRHVYCYNTKSIESVNCAQMFWIHDPKQGGRALSIKNAEKRLEEEAPLKLLKEVLPCF